MTSPNQGADAGWQEPELFTKLPTMAEREKRLLLLEQRNQTLMEKIRSLQKANANLRQLNTRLREENEVFKSTEEILLRDNDKIRKKVHQLKELQESLQDDIYVLEEQLCACTCREDKKEEPLEALNPVEPFSL